MVYVHFELKSSDRKHFGPTPNRTFEFDHYPVSGVSNPVFTETEKPGNPGFFQNRKTGFWLPVNPVFWF